MRSAVVALAFIMPFFVFAGSKNQPKNGTVYTQIKEAWTRRVLPGRPEVPITNEYHFLLLWKSEAKPGVMLCYVGNKWHSVTIMQTEQIPGNVNTIAKNKMFSITPAEPANPPLKHFKPANNSIIFKINNNWFLITAKNIERKPDLALP